MINCVIIIGLVIASSMRTKSQEQTEEVNLASIDAIKTILYEPIESIQLLESEVILYNLRYLQNVDIATPRKTAVFEAVKGERVIADMNITELEALGTFLQGIPGSRLAEEVNYTDWDMLEFLGRATLNRKLAGIIAYCLKKEHGKVVITNYDYINRLNGIVCGFGTEDLAQIDDDNFILINEHVFQSLDVCNHRQLQVLFNIAIRTTVYGIPQGWNKSVVRTVGLIMCVVPIADIKSMDPSSFEGLSPKVLKALSITTIEAFEAEIASFTPETLEEYRQIMGIPS